MYVCLINKNEIIMQRLFKYVYIYVYKYVLICVICMCAIYDQLKYT